MPDIKQFNTKLAVIYKKNVNFFGEKRLLYLSEILILNILGKIFLHRENKMKKLFLLMTVAFLSGCSIFHGPICSFEDEEIVLKITDSRLAAVLHFADGKADLSAKDLKIVQDVAKRAIESDANVIVYGHASHRTRTQDPIQRIIVNIEVSNERAINTAKALADAGVSINKINNVAMFDSRPLKKEITRADEAANRRAEIYLYWFE